jgi:hypothetical protein
MKYSDSRGDGNEICREKVVRIRVCRYSSKIQGFKGTGFC